MTAISANTPILQFFGNNNLMLAGGTLLTQIGGVNATTYQDSALTIPLPNPIPLNSRGEISNAVGASQQLFLQPGQVYTFTLYDPNGNQIWQAKSTGSGSSTVSVLTYGAVGDGVTDDYPAFAAALASGFKTISVPDPTVTYRLSAGIVVPNDTLLLGTSMEPADQNGIPHGTVLKFDNGVAVCVTLGQANNTTANIENLVVWRTGTPPAGSIGIFHDRTNNDYEINVCSVNHAILRKFFASGAAGITASMLNCWGSDCTDKYFVYDSWPELRLTNCRFGRIGSGEASGNAFWYITGTGTVGGGIGPNTLVSVNCQYNQGGVAGPAYFMEFDGLASIPQGNQAQFNFMGCHIENITTAYFKTTNTAPYLQRLELNSTTFNTPLPFFALDPGTQLNQCRISGGLIAGSLTMATSSLINRFTIDGTEITGAVTLNGAAGFNNNLEMTNVFLDSTIDLEGQWAYLYVQGTCNGAITNNASQTTATANILLDIGGVFQRMFGGNENRYTGGTTGVGPQYNSFTYRGPSSAKTVSQASDSTGHQRAYCYDGTQFGVMGLTRWVNSGGAPGAGSTPGAMVVSATPVSSEAPVDYWKFENNGQFYPIVDNGYSVGNGTHRPSALYAVVGTIQTSDLNAKMEIAPSPLGLDFIRALKPVSYKFKEGSKKVIKQNYHDKHTGKLIEGTVPHDAIPGEIITESIPGKRVHHGLIAQEVRAAIPEGIDFGGWIQIDVNNPQSEQGLRYDELIAPIINAIHELDASIKEIKKS